MKFILRNEEILKNAISYLYGLELDEINPQELILKDHKKKRTEDQNALYWSWLRIIGKETGDSTKALHAFYGDEFLPKEEVIVFGKKVLEIKSTTELGVKGFTEYLKQVEAHAASFLGVNLPHPGDLEW